MANPLDAGLPTTPWVACIMQGLAPDAATNLAACAATLPAVICGRTKAVLRLMMLVTDNVPARATRPEVASIGNDFVAAVYVAPDASVKSARRMSTAMLTPVSSALSLEGIAAAPTAGVSSVIAVIRPLASTVICGIRLADP